MLDESISKNCEKFHQVTKQGVGLNTNDLEQDDKELFIVRVPSHMLAPSALIGQSFTLSKNGCDLTIKDKDFNVKAVSYLADETLLLPNEKEGFLYSANLNISKQIIVKKKINFSQDNFDFESLIATKHKPAADIVTRHFYEDNRPKRLKQSKSPKKKKRKSKNLSEA